MSSRSDFDKSIYVLVTAVTNCACIPSMVILWRRKFIFEFFVAVFTFLTSFMYHFCDSIESGAWLEEHKWHRLDNIFSIQAFSCLFIYLTVLPTLRTHLLLNFFSLGFIMLMQEKSPWDVFYTIVPVLLLVLFFIGVVVARALCKNDQNAPAWLRIRPKYHSTNTTLGFIAFVIALCFFARGLDDGTDPYRFFHGCWHMFVGISAYFFWNAVTGPVGTPDLYHWPAGAGMTLPDPYAKSNAWDGGKSPQV